MSINDRQYYQNDPYNTGGPSMGGGIGIGMPKPTPAVKWLLIINLGMFVLQLLTNHRIDTWLAAVGHSPALAIQLWRLITFQFLHANFMHILFNMLGLFFLGPVLERSWGTRSFLKMYLISGAVGGALFTIATLTGIMNPGVLVGASGGVLALMVACAILFPHFKVIFILFPVPIRFAAVILTVMYVLNVLSQGQNAGGDLCHLGGMATGFVWVMWRPFFVKMSAQHTATRQNRQQQSDIKHEIEVDRILAKVHEKGIQSLTTREKDILRKATEQQKHRHHY